MAPPRVHAVWALTFLALAVAAGTTDAAGVAALNIVVAAAHLRVAYGGGV